ncbi:CAP domain-containing protein [Mycolicibacterium palauense]|uniref:CAP domain-containing protein n=1 Tax=Mycolicibacterium palauense TaxID=2034511 RepID=UPI001FEADBAA|nr:CAP domain-containing protein [Mycolicibacterium palauense]
MVKRQAAVAVIAAAGSVGALLASPTAAADNRRLNDGVVANVYTIQQKAGCSTEIKVNPKLRLAAQWHTNDVLNNPALNGDVGSDGSTVADRARNAGYAGAVAETTAINPALAINNLDVLKLWYYRPDYYGIMSDCSNIDIGVWSENHFPDRSVVVAVYGKGDTAAPVMAPERQFGQVPGWTP